MSTGVWTDGTTRINGWWNYNRSSDSFSITLDSIDPVTNQQRTVSVGGDHPDFAKFRIIESNGKPYVRCSVCGFPINAPKIMCNGCDYDRTKTVKA